MKRESGIRGTNAAWTMFGSLLKIGIALQPVHTAIKSGHVKNLFLKFVSQVIFCQSPTPVASDGGRLVHPTAVIVAKMILYGNDTGLCDASHDKSEKR